MYAPNDDEPLKVELKVLKAEHNGFYYDFNCHQSKAQNQLASIEFEEFKKSIKLI
jgi:threonyl-tRNA synthetase